MDAQIKFDKVQHFDLCYVAMQIVKYFNGEVTSMSLRDLQTAMSELKSVERTCEEIEPVLA